MSRQVAALFSLVVLLSPCHGQLQWRTLSPTGLKVGQSGEVSDLSAWVVKVYNEQTMLVELKAGAQVSGGRAYGGESVLVVVKSSTKGIEQGKTWRERDGWETAVGACNLTVTGTTTIPWVTTKGTIQKPVFVVEPVDEARAGQLARLQSARESAERAMKAAGLDEKDMLYLRTYVASGPDAARRVVPNHVGLVKAFAQSQAFKTWTEAEEAGK